MNMVVIYVYVYIYIYDDVHNIMLDTYIVSLKFIHTCRLCR